MQRLEECKADIRQLTSGEREQLILWLAKGMPDSAEVGAAPAAANDPILNILEMELSELLGHRSALELSGGRGEDIYRLNERIAVKRQELEARKTPAGSSPSALSGAGSVPVAVGGTDPALGQTFERTAADPFFAGHRLAELRRQQGITPEEQAAALGMDLPALALLCLCRQPRDMADVDMISARMGWEAGRMADLLGVPEAG